MTNKKKQEVERIYAAMAETEPGSDEYQTLIDQLNELEKHPNARELKAIDVAGKIGAILIVLYFERSGAIISKAFNFVRD